MSRKKETRKGSPRQPSAGELKAIVRANKRERGLVQLREVWLLPEHIEQVEDLIAALQAETELLA